MNIHVYVNAKLTCTLGSSIFKKPQKYDDFHGFTKNCIKVCAHQDQAVVMVYMVQLDIDSMP